MEMLLLIYNIAVPIIIIFTGIMNPHSKSLPFPFTEKPIEEIERLSKSLLKKIQRL